jgi:hypothetical protein
MIILPLVPLRKRPIFTSFFGLASGVSSVLGPVSKYSCDIVPPPIFHFLGNADSEIVQWAAPLLTLLAPGNGVSI